MQHPTTLRARFPALITLLACACARANEIAYVTGFLDGNVVAIDLSTGASTQVVTLAPGDSGDRPRGVAIDGAGNIYVGLRGGTQNVKKFSPTGTFLGDFTSSIGGFGTGHIVFVNGGADLIVAGDVSANIYRYNGGTGAQKSAMNYPGYNNVVGIFATNRYAYGASLFTNQIERFDLSQNPETGISFITDNARLNQPLGLTIGGDGNLFIGNLRSPLIQEYDINTGAFARTFADLTSIGFPSSNLHDLKYDPMSGDYFLTVGTNSLYELNSAGSLVRTYSSSFLTDAYGITIVPEPSALCAASMGLVMVLSRRKRNQRLACIGLRGRLLMQW